MYLRITMTYQRQVPREVLTRDVVLHSNLIALEKGLFKKVSQSFSPQFFPNSANLLKICSPAMHMVLH